MKPFQKLLLAVAGTSLIAPAASSAAEINLAGVNQYASQEQVTSISQFSDVRPTDWAYQALSNLIERYGCVAGYPDGTYKGGRAMTRYEAAALLNACLDRVTEVTDELKRLMAEFEKELAVLKGRVDGLEAKVGELEASQFSTTTKLKGQATMVLGGAGNTGFGDEVTVNYDARLIFDTSFTGKDLLRTTLRAGNFADSALGRGNTRMEVAFQEDAGVGASGDVVGINRLFYKFPIADGFTATVGAKVRQDDMLAIWPTAYPADSVLNLFSFAGARAVYSKNLGAGVGLSYKKDGFSVSANYVSREGAADSATVGVGEDLTATVQFGYAAANWGVAAAYTYANFGTYSDFAGGDANSFGLSGYWSPLEGGWVPSISAGFGFGDAGNPFVDADEDTWTWMVGLQWSDMFLEGNTLGMAIGSAGSTGRGTCASTICTGGLWVDNGQDTLAYELWYKFQVTDNISVTPAFFWVENTGVDDTYGGLVKTTFRF
jgi:hypothetical protein